MRRIVVIGGLAAGPAAAARAARTDPSAHVTLVEAGRNVSYGVCELAHLVSGVISDSAQLTPFSAATLARDKGLAEVLVEHRAIAVDTRSRRVSVRDARGGMRDLAYDALVLATGAVPKTPATGGARHLKSVADAVAIRDCALAVRTGHAAVLGAGYIGLEAADSLRTVGLEVTLVDREALPLRGLEEEGRRLVLDALTERGIRFAGGTEVQTGMVDGADLVVAALGVVPATTLAEDAGIELGTSGAIRVDERCETSAIGVFAAGDCAEVVHAVTGRRAPIGLATVANRMGRAAGRNAAGGNERFGASVGALAFEAFGLGIGMAGVGLEAALAAGFDAAVTTIVARSKAGMMPGAQPILVSLIVERPTGRVLGANVIGADGATLRVSILAPLIARGATVHELARVDLPYAPTFSPLPDPVVTAARVAERELGR